MSKRKVKIVKAPSGQRHVGDQMGYGLYRGQSVRDFNAFNETDPHEDIRNVFPEVPRDEANIEVEKGEKIIARDGMSLYDVEGKKHSQGGTPVKAEPGSYVVSDYITAPKQMQAMMGFEIPSNKKKDNTWAKVLESKVKSKDYNRLAEFLRQAAQGEPVDQYELATAKNKMQVYQDYVSKAALGNELTKMATGKEYKFPELARPAMQKLFPDLADKLMPRENEQAEQQAGQQEAPQQEMAEGPEQGMAYGGEYYSLPKALEGKDIVPYKGGKTKAGTITPGGYSNVYNRDANYLQQWEQLIPGISNLDNRSAQSAIYDFILQNNPDAINQMWKQYGLTNLGRKYKDLVSITSRDSKGRPTYKFDKDLSPEQMKALKKAYTDSYFGVRQLDPSLAPSPPEVHFNPEGDIAPPEEDQDQQQTTPGDKWFCSANGVMSMPANLAKEGQGITYYNSKSEAEAACGKKEIPGGGGEEKKKPLPGEPNFVGKQDKIKQLPFLEDALKSTNALVNMYGYRNVYPFRKTPEAIGYDPAFYSTAAGEALLAGQAKTAMEDSSLYAGSPQAQQARQYSAFAQTMPSLMSLNMGTQQANIGEDTKARIYNANVATQNALNRANTANQLTDMNAKLIHNIDTSKVKGRTKFYDALTPTIQHARDQYLINQMFPQKAYNPLTGELFFHDGKSLQDDVASGTGTSGGYSMTDYPSLYKQAMEQVKLAGVKDQAEQHKEATKLIAPYFRGSRQSQSTNAYGYPTSYRSSYNMGVDPGYGYAANSQDDWGYAMGGFVPVYHVGDW